MAEKGKKSGVSIRPSEFSSDPNLVDATMEEAVALLIDKERQRHKLAKDDVPRTTESIERFVNSPELKETIRSLNQTLKSLDKVARDIDADAGPAVTDTLDQIASLARSLRILADYLEQHPESLIRGKKPSKGE